MLVGTVNARGRKANLQFWIFYRALREGYLYFLLDRVFGGVVNLVVVFELIALEVEGNDRCLFCRVFSVGSIFPSLLPPSPFYRGLTLVFCTNVSQTQKGQTMNQNSQLQNSNESGTTFGVFALFAWIYPIVGLPVSILAIVRGSKANESGSIVMGSIGLLLSLINAFIGVAQYKIGLLLSLINALFHLLF